MREPRHLTGDYLSYLDMVERSALEEERRARERAIIEEGRWGLLLLPAQVTLGGQEAGGAGAQVPGRGAGEGGRCHQPQARELSQQRVFGWRHTGDPRRRRVTEVQDPQAWAGGLEDRQDALAFGRPGCGAPARTKSGRIRTTMIGNPEIRFQANEGVQKSISNNIRYAVDKDEKAQYHAELEEQVP